MRQPVVELRALGVLFLIVVVYEVVPYDVNGVAVDIKRHNVAVFYKLVEGVCRVRYPRRTDNAPDSNICGYSACAAMVWLVYRSDCMTSGSMPLFLLIAA